MLAVGATGLTYQTLGALGSGNTAIVNVRAQSLEVLERQVNARGRIENNEYSRNLGAIHIAGSGKGLEVMVSMFMQVGAPNLGAFTSDDEDDGLRAFFYGGETPEALWTSFRQAQVRADAWAPVGDSWVREFRAWEFGGASDGLRFVGCFVMHRLSPQ